MGKTNDVTASVREWCNKLSISSLTAIKSDVKDGLRMHVHISFGAKTPMGSTSEYCATFYLAASLEFIINTRHRGDDSCVSLVKLNPELFYISKNSDKGYESMFIGIINISEKRKCVIPCPVRLQTLDCCPLHIGQSIDNISADVPGTLTFEETRTVPDGELDIVGCGTFEQPELPNQIVEGRPEIVADVTDDKWQLNGKFLNLFKPENMIGCLSLIYNLRDDFIGLTISEPLSQFIVSSKVILCSADFEKRTSQRMHSTQGDNSGQKNTKNTQEDFASA